MRLRDLPDPDHLPALDPRHAIERPALDLGPLDHPPRILLLYGSLRQRSFSRLATEEAARLLRFFGAEPRIFDPSDLPHIDQLTDRYSERKEEAAKVEARLSLGKIR